MRRTRRVNGSLEEPNQQQNTVRATRCALCLFRGLTHHPVTLNDIDENARWVEVGGGLKVTDLTFTPQTRVSRYAWKREWMSPRIPGGKHRRLLRAGALKLGQKLFCDGIIWFPIINGFYPLVLVWKTAAQNRKYQCGFKRKHDSTIPGQQGAMSQFHPCKRTKRRLRGQLNILCAETSQQAFLTPSSEQH